ncbi:hypothetical protein ABB37_01206 [Leptomonas pyrrhocoris]|uniref:PSP1 C-terminal domain-containing protein n=1 Tax=Leptomonas pyrrhocoris TaxID=157538 RepID=A0A0N0DZ24_LEPPY|nr:hypothetical protein ABB37_01206 [Leptomonas pyrrhocoris]KPA84702.1 hypothetical protein ABB37_01206 [Leptomonas pyrrhocoris]|eukprot:XP_015663141.1 hypothetical protein ABB37_01206 [Leptomonas pyrrhocoris]
MAVTAAEALDDFKAARRHLAQLLTSSHSWASNSWSDTPVPSASVSRHKLQPHARNAVVPVGCDVADTYCQIQIVLEDTSRILDSCKNEVNARLSRQSNAYLSTSASCGISSASSPYDVQRSVTHALRAFDANIPLEVACGSTSLPAQIIPILSGFSLADTPNATELARQETPPFTQRFVTKQPTRMRWPAAQFCYVVHVEFKRGRVRRFFNRVPVKPASYALVPGDRGYDCGLVIQCALWNPHKHAYDNDTVQSLDAVIWPPGNHGTIMEVIRLATDDEVHRLHNEHVSMERLALSTCRDVADRLLLPMEVLDCEYQYDGTKISFFFDSTEMIDFRQLNKELYRIFNARIWMQNTNGAVRNGAPPSAASPQRWRDHQGHPFSDTK